MARPRRSAASPMNPNAPEAPPSDTAATPRSARGGGGSLVAWEGCPLVEVDPKAPKLIPANATVALKVELKGWTDIGDDVPECRLGQRVPIDVIANLEFTRDDLHRRYGPGIYFVHAYIAGDGDKGGTTLHTPITGQTHTIEPLDFDDEKANDPKAEEDDVGTQAWRVPASALASNTELKEEIARRKEVRRELGIGEERARGGDRPGRGGRMGRGNDRGRGEDRGRGGRSGGREWGPEEGRGGGFDDEPEMPEEMLDPSWVPPAAPPGLVWAWDAYKLHWKQYPAGSVTPQAAAPVAPAAREPSFFETPAGVAAITGVFTAIAAIGKAVLEPKPVPTPPDPMTAFTAMMTAINGTKGDPKELKQLEIEAETKRLAREDAARIEAARLAKEQRDHEVTLERERIAAAERAAIAAAAAADAREDKMLSRRLNGLIPPEGPTEAQRKAEMDLAMMKLRMEMMEKSPKSPDMMEMFEKTKATLAKFGVKMGEGATEASLADMMDTPAAKALAENLAPAIGSILMKFAGASPTPPAPIVAPAPVIQVPDPVASHHAIQQEINAARQYGQQEGFAQAQQLAAQNPPTAEIAPAQEPAPEQAPPAMPQWEAAEAPAAPEAVADPAPPQKPPAEALADPEPAPAPAVEPEVPQAPPVEESAPVAEVPASEPAVSVIDRTPDGSTDVVPVTEAAA